MKLRAKGVGAPRGSPEHEDPRIGAVFASVDVRRAPPTQAARLRSFRARLCGRRCRTRFHSDARGLAVAAKGAASVLNRAFLRRSATKEYAARSADCWQRRG